MDALEEAIRVYIALKAPATSRAYISALKKLHEFLLETGGESEIRKRFVDFSPSDVMSFLLWLRQQTGQGGTPTSDATLHQRGSLLRRLYRHLAALRFVPSNPWDAVADVIPKRQRKQKRPTKVIPFSLVWEALDAPSERTRDGIRDRAILALLFGGGLRRSEVIQLNVDSVAVTPEGVLFLVVHDSKSGQEQHKALPAWAWERFSTLVSQRKAEGAKERDPLFVFYYRDGRPRGRLSVETLRRDYKNFLSAVGVSGASPHSARTTFASWLKSEGHDDRSVAEALGHSSTDAVATYDKRARGPNNSIARRVDYKNSEKAQ